MKPRILVTLQAPSVAEDPDAARRRNAFYIEAVGRHGGEPLTLDETADAATRASAFGQMNGLLLTGGGDLDPALYGEPMNGSEEPERGRDRLERDAWDAARRRRVPVLGICRGHQAINVFMGGRLIQHLEHHRGRTHPLRVTDGTRLSSILGAREIEVNSSHHQGLRREHLAPGLRVSGVSAGDGDELVEAFESAEDGEFLIGVQCHPEREPTAPFSPLWASFVEAAARDGASEPVAEAASA